MVVLVCFGLFWVWGNIVNIWLIWCYLGLICGFDNLYQDFTHSGGYLKRDEFNVDEKSKLNEKLEILFWW